MLQHMIVIISIANGTASLFLKTFEVLKHTNIKISAKIKQSPTVSRKVARKEKMISAFFNLTETKVTSVGWKVHIFSPKKFPCIKSILQKQPKEHLMFHLTTSSPIPFESWVNKSMTHKELISSASREGCTPPNIGPRVIMMFKINLGDLVFKNLNLLKGLNGQRQVKGFSKVA